jgi:threonine dehydrogenase-like Zn-dependent dehydrogenase
MKAACWYGKKDVRVKDVPEPSIVNPRDAIVRVTSTAICGSDLHIYNAYIPTMKNGDIIGHECMGEVVDIGPGVENISVGDRVVVACTIGCGRCQYCREGHFPLCDNSNPAARIAEEMNGYATGGLFGYSHLYGGYAGAQAEFIRVPFADTGLLRVPKELSDEELLFLSDIFPTGYMIADHCNIQPGQVVAVWGCGPVGQFAIRSAIMLGADKVIAIDDVPERLRMAEDGGAITINAGEDVHHLLKELTGGRGPDACIDAVGMEAHGSAYDSVKQAMKLEMDRLFVLRQVLRLCRKGGVVSLGGVYVGMDDKFPIGMAFAKSLTLRMGQVEVQHYAPSLLEKIETRQFNPSFVVTHQMPLKDIAKGYAMFNDKKDGCIKVVLKP